MLKRRWKQVFIFINIVTDILVLILSAIFCKAIAPALFNNGISGQINNYFLISFILTYLFFSSVEGIYRGSYNISISRYSFGAFKAFVQTSFIIISTMVFIKIEHFERSSLLLFIIIAVVFIFISKILLKFISSIAQKYGFGMQKALVVDPLHFSRPLIDRLFYNPNLGYEIKGFVGKTEKHKTNLKYYTLNNLPIAIKEEQIDTLFIPSTNLFLNGYQSLEQFTKKSNLKIKVLSPTSESLFKHLGIYDLVGVSINEPLPDNSILKLKNSFKRIFDLIVSFLLIIILSPILIIISLAIIIESGFPIIYKQKRSSIKGGIEFNFYKFRSMAYNAEIERENLQKKNESSGLLFKIKYDPRVTRLGKYMRKFSLDELPQLFNVLKGNMSLVGPRPLPVNDLTSLNYTQEYWNSINLRSKVKPGMTGLWQIYGRSEIKFDEMILLDLYYVENHSILFDLEIIYQTIPVVLFGKGAW